MSYSLRRNNGLRPPRTKEERKMFIIVVEGKSEEKYFNHFMSSTGPRIHSCDGKGISKIELVKRAMEIRDSAKKDNRYLPNDETWVVFDRDMDRQKPNDKNDFIEALKLAKQNNIEVAYSNDAFELWFLLHFQDVTAELSREEIDKKLKEYLGSYKHGNDIYDKINPNYKKAVERAKRQVKTAKESGLEIVDANPSTNVYELTEKLLNNK